VKPFDIKYVLILLYCVFKTNETLPFFGSKETYKNKKVKKSFVVPKECENVGILEAHDALSRRYFWRANFNEYY
jgi:hypothetical protein